MNHHEKDSHSLESSDYQGGIVISPRYVGPLGACVIMVMVTIFMGGYFLGKKKALEAFCKATDRESLADQIFVALCGVADYKEAQTPTDIDEVVEEQETPISSHESNLSPENSVAGPETGVQEQSQTNNQRDQSVEQSVGAPLQASTTVYHAELIGFGTMQGAKRFAHRMNQQRIPVTINKRVSKTAKGRTVTWYQVVTAPHSNKDELVALVNTIKQQERLNDIRIVTHC